MLEGIINTVYSDAAHIRPRLLTPGGNVSIAGAAETAISTTDAARFGYLFLLDAICTVVATTAGTWTLRLALAGATALVLQQPVAAAAVGTRYCWSFPVPWKTTALAGVFTIQGSVATLGTWSFHCNGFRSSL